MHILPKKSADLLSEVLYMFKSQLNFTLFHDVTKQGYKSNHLLAIFVLYFLTLGIKAFFYYIFLFLSNIAEIMYTHFFIHFK